MGLDRALWRLAAVVVLRMIMSILDTTIVNVAIETLARDLDASLASIQWVSTGYLLALATVIPFYGCQLRYLHFLKPHSRNVSTLTDN